MGENIFRGKNLKKELSNKVITEMDKKLGKEKRKKFEKENGAPEEIHDIRTRVEIKLRKKRGNPTIKQEY